MFDAAKKRMEERQKEQIERDKKRAKRKELVEEKRLAKKKRNGELYKKAKEMAVDWRDVEEIKLIFKRLKNENK